MKKIYLFFMVLLVCVGLGICIYLKVTNNVHVSLDDIQEVKYNKLNNNLYYTDYLIESKGKDDKEIILEYYEIISNYLSIQFPSLSFCITNLNYDTLNGQNNEITFNLYQLVDMAVIDETMFSLKIKDGKIIEYYDIEASNFIQNSTIGKTSISINDSKEIALDLAKENYDKMFANNDKSRKITGTVYLRYNKQDNFYYYISLNSSYVKISAATGKIIDSYFFNGLMS